MNNFEIKYSYLPGAFVLCNEHMLTSLADFYSQHYGVWGEKGLNPGNKIRLSSEKLSKWLKSEDTYVYYAEKEDELVGYAIVLESNTSLPNKIVTWVTQLVVHEKYRNMGVAKNLLYSIWGLSNHFAWGIVSANPYAIRALEKATRRRANPIRIKRNVRKIKNIGKKYVPYIDEDMEIIIDEGNSKINTSFFVDHKGSISALKDVISRDNPWKLGMIEDGWEWFAFTFFDQEQIRLSAEEIENMVKTADSVVKNAYNRMDLNPIRHRWMSHEKEEIDYILNRVPLKKDATIFDIGCGKGRHSIELGRRGYHVVGVDYLEDNIDAAKKKVIKEKLETVQFEVSDCRTYRSEAKADLCLCLYDVIGSYADKQSNRDILERVYDLLKYGGKAVISVMNYEMTEYMAKYRFKFGEKPNELLNLMASDTMQNTGEVFNPEYYMIDEREHIVYRREQFTNGRLMPVELVVRDRRYTMEEISMLCKEIGFKVIERKYTHATSWLDEFIGTDRNAKEILLVCEKT